MQFDWSAIWPAIPLLLEGAKMTLWISVLGLAGGPVIGLAAGFARTFGGWFANHIAPFSLKLFAARPSLSVSCLSTLPCRWHLMICVLIRSAQRS